MGECQEFFSELEEGIGQITIIFFKKSFIELLYTKLYIFNIIC